MTDETLGFVHRWLPGASADAPTLLLLHGTGGDENDLVPLGRRIAPGAALLSPRGKTLEHGMPRFFRRLAEGVFDTEDLVARTHELAEFVRAASRAYGFDADRVIAAGYSNGANIASSLLLLRPEILRGAVLYRAMVPLEPERLPDLTGRTVFAAAGRTDTLIPAAQTERLAELLRGAGADVTLHWEAGGHALTGSEVDASARWLARSGSLGHSTTTESSS